MKTTAPTCQEVEEYRQELQRLVELGIEGASRSKLAMVGGDRWVYDSRKSNRCGCGQLCELLPNGLPVWGCGDCIERDRRDRKPRPTIPMPAKAPLVDRSPAKLLDLYK